MSAHILRANMRIILFLLICLGSISCCNEQVGSNLTYYIDTRVGTAANAMSTNGRYGKGSEEYGQTLPSVLEPNGMNFWTPQTKDSERKCISPYYYKDSLIQGFRNSHWIVGGCAQDYGSMTLFPSTAISYTSPSNRGVLFSHSDEIATPSYYSVYMKGSGITAEMTGRSRSAIFRFSYPEELPAYLIVNPNSDEGVGHIEIDTVRKEIRGYNPIHRIYQGWGKPAGYNGYFVVKYSDAIEDYGTYCDNTIFEGETMIENKKNIGLWIRFHRKDPSSPVIVRASSSFTDMEGALNNLYSEIPHQEFNDIRRELSSIWDKHLGQITVTSTYSSLLRKFYGSLYRASFLPRTISDVDGRYPMFSKGKNILKSEDGRPVYDDYSMWDTFRALHPLLVLVSPSKSANMMQSLVLKYKQGGWLPIFPCWNSYTAAMIGDHCTAAIGDAIVKGIRDFDVGTAYEAMRKNAFEMPETQEEYANGMGRRALESYLKYGYIPLEDSVSEAFHTKEQTSRTLEYAYDDFVLSQVAAILNKDEDYAILKKRSENYRNVIDPTTGYANGRYKNGSFCEDNNPFALAPYITEGAPCHYTWFAPHDPHGLMEAMGGRSSFIEKLDTLFEGEYYWHGNEPCHQVAYLYDYAGEPWKTQEYVYKILTNEYGDIPGGLAGNDDAGQMSAWFVFSSLGFYPVCPGSQYYALGTPRFDKAEIRLENGNKFTIITKKTGRDNIFIEKASLNGREYSKNYISHQDILSGGMMEFVMGDLPCKSRGNHKDDNPPDLFQIGRR